MHFMSNVSHGSIIIDARIIPIINAWKIMFKPRHLMTFPLRYSSYVMLELISESMFLEYVVPAAGDFVVAVL